MPHVDVVGKTLDRQSVLQGNPLIPHFRTPINVGAFLSTRGYTIAHGICGIHCCVLHASIRIGNRTSIVFFSAYEFFDHFYNIVS